MDLKIDVETPETASAAEGPPPPAEAEPPVWRPAGPLDWLALALGGAAMVAGLSLLPSWGAWAWAVVAGGAALPLLVVAVRAVRRWLRRKIEAVGSAVEYIGGKIS
jgi:hypothetical protein